MEVVMKGMLSKLMLWSDRGGGVDHKGVRMIIRYQGGREGGVIFFVLSATGVYPLFTA